MSAPVAADAAQESVALTRQLVAAIRWLNQPEFLERGRELKLRRGAAGKRLTVEVVDRETGEILDELPPEAVLRMMAELEKEREGEL
ncbi:hypothetical protein SBA3_5260002 [Candidatus Sulfopaludibacter sp. SbA3]|nr:hypothetical protein SBA3_5260002 [Candidatus Sulfopaludibacter sp. SbA3]